MQRWAFVAHRASGVAVFAFLTLHVFDVALYALSPARFDDVHELYGTAAMRVFECLLLFAILFHTLNGLRLVLLDVVEVQASYRPQAPARRPRAHRRRGHRSVGRDPEADVA
jgi:succinate dehydrogenase / fumarate reductase cytochrome b subunit